MFSLVLAVCMLCSILALGTAAVTTETLYDDGTYHRVHDIIVNGVDIGYVESMYLTCVVYNNISQLQLATETRGGPISSYRTTSETRIYTILKDEDEGGKLEEMILSSETEGTRLLSAVVTFTNCDIYLSDHIHGWVKAESVNKTSGASEGDICRRWWDGREWTDA